MLLGGMLRVGGCCGMPVAATGFLERCMFGLVFPHSVRALQKDQSINQCYTCINQSMLHQD
jgi:hypothetical protein